MNVLHRISSIALVALMGSACADQNMTNESGPNDLSNQAPSFSAIPGAAVVVDFDSYTDGSVNGQDDWSSTGPYDQAVVANGPPAPASFGTKSLRISNAITSGSFGDQTFSKRLVNAAGETTADENGFALGAACTRITSKPSGSSPRSYRGPSSQASRSLPAQIVATDRV